MISFRELAGMGLAGLISATIEPQEIPKNFGPVGRVISQEEDKNNNGVLDTEEKVIDYNNSTYKYFRVYNKETKKQTYFIADKEYKIIKDPVAYYHLFSVITINESMTRAKKQNFEEHLTEWAEDYQKINKAIARMEYIKKSMESIFELEGSVINKRFFGDTKAPEALDYLLVKGSEHIAKKRTSDDFDNILKELAGNLSKDKPKDIAKHVLDNMKNITTKRIDNARSHLLFARKILENYDPNKDFLSLSQAEKYVENIIAGLEGITYARAYTASLGPDNSLIGASKIIAENFTKGLTGVSVDEIYANLTKNEHLKKIKDTISESRIKLTESLGSLYNSLHPKEDPTLEALLLEEKIIAKEKSNRKDKELALEDKIEIMWAKRFNQEFFLSLNNTMEMEIVKDKSNSVYVSGLTHSTKTSEKIDIFLMKVDAEAQQIWTKQFKTQDSDRFGGMATDKENNIYMVQNTKNSSYLAKFNNEGDNIWTKELAKKEGYGSIVIDDKQEIYLIRKKDTTELLEKFNSDGKRIWSKQVKIDSVIKTDSLYNLSAITTDKDNIYLTNRVSVRKKEDIDDDIFVAKYNKDGEEIWHKRFGTNKTDTPISIKADNKKNIYIIGHTLGDLEESNKGYLDCLLIKLSSEGEVLWKKQWGTKNADLGKKLFIDDRNNIYVDWVNNDKGTLAKYDEEGNKIWSRTFEGDVMGFTLDKDYNIYISGHSGNKVVIMKLRQK